jgi:hypothetical protein
MQIDTTVKLMLPGVESHGWSPLVWVNGLWQNHFKGDLFITQAGFYARHTAAKLPVREWAFIQLVGAQAALLRDAGTISI